MLSKSMFILNLASEPIEVLQEETFYFKGILNSFLLFMGWQNFSKYDSFEKLSPRGYP